MMQQNQVPPQTAQILQLMGEINPVTPEGTPTAAANVLNQAAQAAQASQMQQVPQAPQQPDVQDLVGQVGIAAQLEAMKMQQAQEALMQQAQGGQGVEALNTGIEGYAEGGIVGYARAGGVEDMPFNPTASIDVEQFARERELLDAEAEARRAERERRDQEARMEWLRASAPEVAARLQAAQTIAAPAAEGRQAPPPAPPAPPARVAQAAPEGGAPRSTGLATSSAPAFKQLMDEYEKLTKMPRTEGGTATLDRAMAERATREEFARRTGNDPELMAKMAGEYERIYTDQLNKIEARRAAAEERAERGGIAAWLRGFRQMQGQGIGEGFRTASEAGAAFDENMRARIERLEDMSLEIQRARMEKVNALRQQKYLTDMGDFANARKAGEAALGAAREEQILKMNLLKFQAGEQSQEARTAATVRAQEAARAEAAAARSEQEKQRVLLSAQGRVTEAEKLLASVREKNAAALAMPATVSGPGKQMRDNAVNAVAQAEENLRQARILYNTMINQNLGIASAAPQVTGGTGQFKLVGVQPAPR